ncbi:MAG: hypothetical protein QGG17_00170 [Rhodospirillales bacterium]|nr:hypothetical protein [Rhodospirillales bacterium]MDP6804612.1 hypothetical protein [Rhodospirillales bacterium]
MIVLTETDVRGLLSVEDSFACIEDAWRRYGAERAVTSMPAMSVMVVPGEAPTPWGIKGAVLPSLGLAGVFFGAQFGSYTFAVCDCRTGVILGLVEQSWLTKRRTAVTAAITAKHLAPPGASVAAVIGAGRIGAEAVRMLDHAFDLAAIRIASRTLDGAEAACAALEGEVAAPLIAATVADAVTGADIVVTLTLASAPVIGPGMLGDGAVLCSMGGVHEVEFGVLAETDRVIVDELDYALLRGDFAAWIARGEITQEALKARIDADMGAVAGGFTPGRTGARERILAVIQGMAVCDLAQAAMVLERAREAGVGSEVSLEAQRTAPAGEDHALTARLVAEGLSRRGKAH